MQLLKSIDEVAYQALHEDLGDGDLTANLLPEGLQATARLITREDAVLCGTCWFNSVFKQLDKNIEIQWHAEDGIDKGTQHGNHALTNWIISFGSGMSNSGTAQSCFV